MKTKANGKAKVSVADRLTRELTAFQSWAEFVASMKGGYVPTLRAGAAHRKLARIIVAHGFRVFPLGRWVV
jgi:hypothetical protein